MKQRAGEREWNQREKLEYDFWLQWQMFSDVRDKAYRLHEKVVKLHEEMAPLHKQTRLLVKASQKLRKAWNETLKK